MIKVNAVERLRAELRAARWRARRSPWAPTPIPTSRWRAATASPRGSSRPCGCRQPVLDPHQVDPDRARHRPARRGGPAHRRGHRRSRSAASTKTCGGPPSPTPPPPAAMEAVAALNEAGVPCGVMIAPVLPGISDDPDQIEAVVRAADRGRRHLDHPDHAAPANGRARPLPRLAERPGPSWRPRCARATGLYGPSDARRDLAAWCAAWSRATGTPPKPAAPLAALRAARRATRAAARPSSARCPSVVSAARRGGPPGPRRGLRGCSAEHPLADASRRPRSVAASVVRGRRHGRSG